MDKSPIQHERASVLRDVDVAYAGSTAGLQINESEEPSETNGMSLDQRIEHVGGRMNAQGYIEFGSHMAVHALIMQVLRDLPTNGMAKTVILDTAILSDALELMVKHYPDAETTHVGYRVMTCNLAEKSLALWNAELAKASPAPVEVA